MAAPAPEGDGAAMALSSFILQRSAGTAFRGKCPLFR